MTVDSAVEPGTDEAPAATDSGAPEPVHVEHSDRLGRWHLLAAASFLVVSSVVAVVTTLQLLLPDLFGRYAFLSYGRLRPFSTGGLLYGWLTIGLIGAIYIVLPRATGRPLRSGGAALAGLVLTGGGWLAGLVAVLLGANQGRAYLESPLWAASVVTVGLLTVAVVVTRSVSGLETLPVPAWFLTAGVWWLVLAHVVGNIPGYDGVNSTLQTAFYQASITGLWFGAAVVGIAYHLVPEIIGIERPSPSRLAWIGFWSLAFAWAGTAPRALVYLPTADWVETIGIIFSVGLVIPVLAIGSELLKWLRGRWGDLDSSMSLLFVLAGAVLFFLIPVANLMMAFRSTAAVVGFTAWVEAYEYLAYFGAFSFWLMAFGYHALFETTGRRPRRKLGLIQFGVITSGLLIALVTALWAGFQEGLTWAAAANTPEVSIVGDGFRNSVTPLEGVTWFRAGGLFLYAVGAILFLAAMVFPVAATGEQEVGDEKKEEDAGGEGIEGADLDAPSIAAALVVDEDLEPDYAAPSMAARPLLVRAVGLFALAAMLVFWLPTLEAAHRDPSLLGDTVRLYVEDSAAARGRTVYLQEGCWYCHTQAVRPIVTDVDFGRISQPGDYVHEAPAAIGVQRIGPDLMYVGGRDIARANDVILKFLHDPRSIRPWSTQPDYSYLSEADMLDLTAYIATLTE